MKKTILAFAVLAIGLVSCKKDLLEQVTEPVTSFTVSIEQTKTSIDGTGVVIWKMGDIINVTGKDGTGATVTRKYSADSDGTPVRFSYADVTGGELCEGPYTATYGDISRQIYSENGANCPMEGSAEAGSTIIKFKNTCAVVKVTLPATSGKSVKSVFVDDFKLDCGEGVSLSEPKTFYVAVDPGIYENLRISIISTDNQVCKIVNSTTEMNLQKNHIKPLSFNKALAFEHGYISNDAGNMVVIAPANLMYHGNGLDEGDCYFCFHSNPDEASYNPNPDFYNHFDWFGWGTSGYNGKNPWMTSIIDDDYYSGNLAGTQYDWGQHNPIYSRPDKNSTLYPAGVWRTPSGSEFLYICSNVSSSYKHGYALIKSDGVHGMLLFSEDFVWPSGISEPTSFDCPIDGNFDNGTYYTLEQVRTICAAGAAFLPGTAAGRSGTQREQGYFADYWCSDSFNTLNIWSDYGPRVYSDNRYEGKLVRLVK